MYSTITMNNEYIPSFIWYDLNAKEKIHVGETNMDSETLQISKTSLAMHAELCKNKRDLDQCKCSWFVKRKEPK